jgi:quinolinate synthase
MKKLIEKINRLKKEKNALILAHNYQRPEIYEIADFIGDSLGLAMKAAKTDAEMIIFCGVHFMAESARILCPGKRVILPAPDAGCPMADMAGAGALRAFKAEYPDAAVVAYINTTAAVKAESDIICTSANAVEIVNSLPQNRIIFLPDRNLAFFVAERTEKEIIPWNGFCYVHDRFAAEDLRRTKKRLPRAEAIAHPECGAEFRQEADCISSTSGMIAYVRNSKAEEFIIGTEAGMLEMLKREAPDKKFFAAPPAPVCANMKKNTLEKVLAALENEGPVVTVPEDIRLKAKAALDRMLALEK